MVISMLVMVKKDSLTRYLPGRSYQHSCVWAGSRYSRSSLLAPPVSPGPASTYIVNGAVVRAHSHPYMAALYVGEKHFCGGSLISPRHVLTAAHCVAGLSPGQASKLVVRLGRHHVHQSQAGDVSRRVVRTLIHPEFQPAPRFYNDIAVLRLSQEVPLSSTVQPICLPSPGGGRGSLAGETGLVLGWGRTREGGPRSQLLRAVDVTVWPEQVCRQAYRGIANILPGMICASKAGHS